MKNKCKKITAVIMALIMMAGITGGIGFGTMFAFADTGSAEGGSAPVWKAADQGKYMKDADENAIKGECWALYEDSELVITGSFESAGWSEYASMIKKVSILSSDVTAIPEGAFSGIAVDSIFIPNTVTSLNYKAFTVNDKDRIVYPQKIFFGGSASEWEKLNAGVTGITVAFNHSHTNDAGDVKNYESNLCSGDKTDKIGYSGDKYCGNCGTLYEIGETLPTDHDWSEEKQPLSGTEYCGTQTQEYATVCNRCAATKDVETKGATIPHDYKDIRKSEKPCDSQDAAYVKICSKCGNEETVPLAESEHEYISDAPVAPTCTKDGYTLQKCKYCNSEKKTDIQPATGHAEERKINPPTCEEDGSVVTKCKNCDYVFESTTIEPHTVGYCEGEYAYTEGKEETCIADGEKELVCKICGKALTTQDGQRITQVVPKDPEKHTPGEWTIVTPVTCVSDGKQEQRCIHCDELLNEKTIKSTGHTFEVIQTADCEAGGGKAKKECSACHTVEEFDVPSNETHQWKTIVEEPQCTEKGYTYKKCTVEGCSGETEKYNYVDELGHDYQAKTTEATCTKDGSKWQECSRCHAQKDNETIPSKGHTPAEPVKENPVPATCTEEGSYDLVVYCSVCGAEISKEHKTEDALGHDTDQEEVPPTCTEDGYIRYYCKRDNCDYSVKGSKTTDALGHDTAQREVAATCTEDGYIEIFCKREGCDFIEKGDKTEEALGHDPKEVIIKEATCTENGSKCTECSRCSEKFGEEEVIPAKGHTPAEAVRGNEVEPSCTVAGSYDSIVKCSVCGEKLEDKCEYGVEVPALGHDKAYHEGQASTCKVQGWNPYYTCRRCDYTTFTELPFAEHTSAEPIKENVVPATCTKEGSYDLVKYCSVCGEEINRTPVTTDKDMSKHTDADRDNVCEACGCLTAYVNLSVPKDTTVNYDTSVTVEAKASTLPNGFYFAAICEDHDEEKADTSGNVSIKLGKVTSNQTVTFKVVNESTGKIAKNSDGTELTATTRINVKAGLLQKIVAFIRNLFRLGSREVIVKPS